MSGACTRPLPRLQRAGPEIRGAPYNAFYERQDALYLEFIEMP
jgi:hypothetical protein